jgi:hypothetical protein
MMATNGELMEDGNSTARGITAGNLVDSSNGTFRPWQIYQNWARSNQQALWLVDETLSRLLFWTSSSARWREAAFGLLELHRLFLELATTTSATETKRQPNLYGTTVRVDGGKQGNFQASNVRLGLTILQSLLPVMQELVRTSLSDRATLQRQIVVRKYTERARFLLRVTLLVSYWKQVLPDGIPPGLLQFGGLYHPHITEATMCPTVQQEQSRLERYNYIGPRTGRRVIRNSGPIENATITKLRILWGELLYVLRPLYQAETDLAKASQQQRQALHSWAACLVMDIASLLLLQTSSSNAITQWMSGNDGECACGCTCCAHRFGTYIRPKPSLLCSASY